MPRLDASEASAFGLAPLAFLAGGPIVVAAPPPPAVPIVVVAAPLGSLGLGCLGPAAAAPGAAGDAALAAALLGRLATSIGQTQALLTMLSMPQPICWLHEAVQPRRVQSGCTQDVTRAIRV